MRTILYTMELLQPVLVTDVQNEPNGAISMPYVSGSLLRGALASRYLQMYQKDGFDALDDTKERALFLSEATRYLNAYPISEEDGRALPTPVAWFYDKNDGKAGSENKRRVFDFSHSIPSNLQEEGVRDDFVWLKGDTAKLFSPTRQMNIHTQRDARKGRATEQAGAVYRYEALAAGLKLQGAILINEDLAEILVSLLQDASFYLGRARRSGYGRVNITQVETLSYWSEVGREDIVDDIEAGKVLQVLMTGDTLLRDEHGQMTLDPRTALAATLGISVDALSPQTEASFVKPKVVGGFNRKWGLPLPQTVAIAAGSVFTYQLEEDVSSSEIDKLEQDGIGERRAEGFGRVVVNWLSRPRYEVERPQLQHIPEPPKKLTSTERGFATLIAERLLRRKLDADLRNKVRTYAKNAL